MNEWLSAGGMVGGALALCQFAYGVYKDRKGGAIRKSAAEAAKAHLDTAQAEAALPHVTEALALGNVQEAVAIQQGIINGLRDHAAWQDRQLEEAHDREAALIARLADRDRQIDELETRLGLAERHLGEAQRIIEGLRRDPDRIGGPHEPTP